MNTYFSTFITGFGNIVVKELKKQFSDIKILLLLDGLVSFATKAGINQIVNLSYLNNTFLLLKLEKQIKNEMIEQMVKNAINQSQIFNVVNSLIDKNSKLRVVVTKENQYFSIDKQLLRKIEDTISVITGLIIDRNKADFEIWFLKRREGFGFVGLRLTKKPNLEKVLSKGELRPELANLLCIISEPNVNDIFLDPFAGSGAIPQARTNFPYNKIFIFDINEDLVGQLVIKFKGVNNIEIIGKDALNNKDILDSSINKIVTDPPWGVFLKEKYDLPVFYNLMLTEFYRILADKGILVILINGTDLFESILTKYEGQFSIEQKIRILVSGQKACVYRIRKQG